MHFSKRETAAGHNSLGHRGLGGTDGVVERFLLRLHLRFGRSPDADHRNAAGQLGEPFLELFAIIVAGRLFDFAADLRNPAVDPTAVAAAADQRRIFLVRDHSRGAPELLQRHILKLQSQFFGDHLRPGQYRDVFQHRLAPVAEAGRLDRADP